MFNIITNQQTVPTDIQYILILILTFVSVLLIIVCLAYLYIKRNLVAERLTRLIKQEKPAELDSTRLNLVDDHPQGLAAKISKPLIRLTPVDPTVKDKSARLRLMQAGLRSRSAFYNFFALKIIGLIGLPAMLMMSMIFVKVTPERLLFLLLLAASGFFLPDLVLYLMTQNRKQQLAKALPDALDLMVVCVEAGLGLDMTFKRVGEEIRAICKELSDEFLLTNLEIRSGQSRQESFKNMALRTGVIEINQLMSMLNQTSRFGTSLATALRVHSDAMRVKRRQTAEEIAAKAAIKLLFPLAFCIFPALFVVLLGPAVIRILRVLMPTMSGG